MRACRKVRAKLQSNRCFLGRFDVLLEKRPIEIGGIEPQPRRAAIRGAKPTHLHPYEVFASRPDFEIIGVQGSIVRHNVDAHFV